LASNLVCGARIGFTRVSANARAVASSTTALVKRKPEPEEIP